MLTDLSATDVVRRIGTGEITAIDITNAAIARIEAMNPALNAIVIKRFEDARIAAHAIDALRAAGDPLPPLAGVPITIKDSIDVAGTPSTYGLTRRSSHQADVDDPRVTLLRDAGAVILGKTNVPQLLLYIETDNPLYGRTQNPWNLDRVAGGSSGGEGVAVAAGFSAIGLGTDIGGSIRVPAAFCGVAGIKPTTGRLPDLGRAGLPPGQRVITSELGPLARTTDDVALALRVLNGGLNPARIPPMPLGDYATINSARLRVGVYREDGLLKSSPAVRRAVDEAAAALTAAGAAVIDWTPPDIADIFGLFYQILSADAGAGLRSQLRRERTHPALQALVILSRLPRRALDTIAAGLRTTGQHSAAALLPHLGHTSVAEYWEATDRLMLLRASVANAMRHAPGGALDVVLGPACAVPALRHGATKDAGTAGAHALIWNALGFPAGVVPVTRVRPGEDAPRPKTRDRVLRALSHADEGSAGLPVAVQIAALPWQEHLVLAAMRAVETAVRDSAGYPHTPVVPPPSPSRPEAGPG